MASLNKLIHRTKDSITYYTRRKFLSYKLHSNEQKIQVKKTDPDFINVSDIDIAERIREAEAYDAFVKRKEAKRFISGHLGKWNNKPKKLLLARYPFLTPTDLNIKGLNLLDGIPAGDEEIYEKAINAAKLEFKNSVKTHITKSTLAIAEKKLIGFREKLSNLQQQKQKLKLSSSADVEKESLGCFECSSVEDSALKTLAINTKRKLDTESDGEILTKKIKVTDKLSEDPASNNKLSQTFLSLNQAIDSVTLFGSAYVNQDDVQQLNKCDLLDDNLLDDKAEIDTKRFTFLV